MSRSWRTVYKSPSKHVLVKPRGGSPPSPADSDSFWVSVAVKAVAALAGVYLALNLIAMFWPVLLAFFIIYAIGFAARRR